MSPFTTSPEKSALEKQIADYTQFQWLSLIPVWVPLVLGSIRSTPTPPDRVLIVLAFRVAMLIFGITCFVLVRAKIGRMKRALAEMERAEQARPLPPIATP